MPSVRLTTIEDVDDYLVGLDLMSANGGGEPGLERELLLEDLDAGLRLGWDDLDDRADGLVVSVAFTGATSPDVRSPDDRAARLGAASVFRRPMVEAVRDVQEASSRPVVGLVSSELGGINGGSMLDAAAVLGLPLVDGDLAGRAIPELGAVAPIVHGLPAAPAVLVDEFGNRLTIRAGASSAFVERMGKHLAQSSFGAIALSLPPLTTVEARRIVAHGTLTQTLDLGRALRRAHEAGADPVEAVATAMGAAVLFRGRLVDRAFDVGEYMEGTHVVDGSDDFAGHRLRLWFRNEHHVTWLDEAPYVSSPDLLEVCHARTGRPLSVQTMARGDEVVVLGRRRPALYDHPAGRAVMEPRHYGFDHDYVPIEVHHPRTPPLPLLTRRSS